MILTYQQQLDLVGRGLAKASVNGKFTTFKYSRKVMYEYLWDKYPELKYCRGQTYDNTNGNLVTLPPAKTFNYLENGTWRDKALDTRVFLHKKYNGFMAALSLYQGEIVISTTGTTNSDYAKLAKESIFKEYPEYLIKEFGNDATWLFEICHESDPHIVQEEFGVHYLGCTSHMDDGDIKAGQFQPTTIPIYATIETALRMAKLDKGEGWMMYDNDGNVCKLKTDYYVGKKKLMRMNKSTIELMYNRSHKIADALPDMWSKAAVYITKVYPMQEWIELTDQERRVILETWYFKVEQGELY